MTALILFDEHSRSAASLRGRLVRVFEIDDIAGSARIVFGDLDLWVRLPALWFFPVLEGIKLYD